MSSLASGPSAPAPFSGGRPIEVLLADDHEVVRDGLRALLEGEGGMAVVAEAADTPEVVRKVLGHKPDVLVLDLGMPGGSPLKAIPTIRESSPDTAIVVLTMQSGPAFAREALRAGVQGYVLKESAGAEIIQAIRTAASGGTFLAPSLGAQLAAEPDVDVTAPDGLTPRELDVLRLIALGHTNAEAADLLFLSRRTVETHRASLQSKTNCMTRSELVRYALKHDLLDLDAVKGDEEPAASSRPA